MQLHSLFLAPDATDVRPEIDRVTETLLELAVIGPALGERSYRVGPRFSQHVVFAGCSPHLVTEPPEDGGPAFSHLVLHGPRTHALLVTAAKQAKPRCPACRQRVDQARVPQAADASWQCPSCRQISSACQLDWRHYGLCGRVLVEVVNVFPGEAAPSDSLLQALHRGTSSPWSHAWARYLGPAGGGAQATTT